MKVYLIHPKAPPSLESLSEGFSWWGVDANVAPLELALLAALTPADVEVQVTDQQAGDAVQFEESADVVVLVAGAAQIPGIRYLCGRFRARRIPVAVAGSYITAFPDRVDSADIKLIGDLEAVYPALLRDLRAGTPPQQAYRAEASIPLAQSPAPRWDIFHLARYRMGAIELSRGGAGEGTVRSDKPVSRVLEELQTLQAQGVRRVWLETGDLLADAGHARPLLEAIAELNARLRPKLSLETRIGLSSVRQPELVALLGRANVRRVELELNSPELAGPEQHEDPREAIEAVRVLLEHGIRVAGRLTVFREGDTAQCWDAQVAVARESLATPALRAARALPGTALYERLKAAGRLIQGGRDAELRHELFDVPNFQPGQGTREEQSARIRQLVVDLYTTARIEQRLRGLFREAKTGPSGGVWPARADVRALARMMAGTVQNPGEQRLRQVGRAVAAWVSERPPVTAWSQGLEQLLEEVALRSFVVKTAEGRALEAAAPPLSWKQRAVALGAKAAGRFAARTPT